MNIKLWRYGFLYPDEMPINEKGKFFEEVKKIFLNHTDTWRGLVFINGKAVTWDHILSLSPSDSVEIFEITTYFRDYLLTKDKDEINDIYSFKAIRNNYYLFVQTKREVFT